MSDKWEKENKENEKERRKKKQLNKVWKRKAFRNIERMIVDSWN